MNKIKIVEAKPIRFPKVCEKIVKIFKKHKLKITQDEAQHLWDLQVVDMEHGCGQGWITGVDRTDKEIFESFKPYYIVDNS